MFNFLLFLLLPVLLLCAYPGVAEEKSLHPTPSPLVSGMDIADAELFRTQKTSKHVLHELISKGVLENMRRDLPGTGVHSLNYPMCTKEIVERAEGYADRASPIQIVCSNGRGPCIRIICNQPGVERSCCTIDEKNEPFFSPDNAPTSSALPQDHETHRQVEPHKPS